MRHKLYTNIGSCINHSSDRIYTKVTMFICSDSVAKRSHLVGCHLDLLRAILFGHIPCPVCSLHSDIKAGRKPCLIDNSLFSRIFRSLDNLDFLHFLLDWNVPMQALIYIGTVLIRYTCRYLTSDRPYHDITQPFSRCQSDIGSQPLIETQTDRK